MEGFNQVPARPHNSAKEALVRRFQEEGSIHGTGLEPLSGSQRADVESVLSRAGMSLDDPSLSDLLGDLLKGLMDYAQMPPSPERTATASTLAKDIVEHRANQLRDN